MTKFTTLMLGATAALLCTSAFAAEDPEVAAQSGDKVAMKYNAGDRENVQRPMPSTQTACAVHIAPTVDRRQNKETVGQNLSGALLAGDVSPWVTDGLRQLKDYGFTVSDTTADAPVADDGVTVRTSITRAYTWQIGLKLFSMVAVKAEFADRNGVLQQKYYRAHGDKTNMWGASSEYVTTLNYGLNNMLPFIAKDLASLCKGDKVAAYSYAGPEGPSAK